jgi:hypothetical protein
VLGTVLNFAPRKKRRGGYDGYGYGYGYGQSAQPEAVPRTTRRQRKAAGAVAAGSMDGSATGSFGGSAAGSAGDAATSAGAMPPGLLGGAPGRDTALPPMPAPSPAGDYFEPGGYFEPGDLDATVERRAIQIPEEEQAPAPSGTGIPRHHRAKRST